MEWCRPNHGRRSSRPSDLLPHLKARASHTTQVPTSLAYREAPTQPSHPERVICTRDLRPGRRLVAGLTSGKVAPERTTRAFSRRRCRRCRLRGFLSSLRACGPVADTCFRRKRVRRPDLLANEAGSRGGREAGFPEMMQALPAARPFQSERRCLRPPRAFARSDRPGVQ